MSHVKPCRDHCAHKKEAANEKGKEAEHWNITRFLDLPDSKETSPKKTLMVNIHCSCICFDF